MISTGYGEAARSGFDRLSRFDAAILVLVRRWEAPRMSRVMTALTRAGDARSWFVHGPLLLVVGGSQRWLLLALLSAAALTATVVSQVLKRTFRRQRPDSRIEGFVPAVENPDAFSFPSGHTSAAFAVATATVTASPLIGAAELAFAVGVGVSRVYLGAHYPADVAAGAGVGVACGACSALACRLLLG